MPKRNFPEVRAWPTDNQVADVAQFILVYSLSHSGEMPRQRAISRQLNLSATTVWHTIKALTLAGALERFAAGATLKKANFKTAAEAQRMVDRYRLSIGVE